MVRVASIARALVFAVSVVVLSACGTLTGIPSHGGGKRFAIEQELVAATVRAAAKDLDVSPLKGRTATVYIVGMGDQGVGNMVGGRYSLNALLRGESVSTPVTRYPVISTTTRTRTTTTVAENALNAPRRTAGEGHRAEAGLRYNGLGAYRTEDVLNPHDAQFLSAIVQESLVLRGVEVTGAEAADFDVYIAVDVFGTVRSRHDWHIANRESLLARTALEMAIMDRRTGEVVMPPQTSSFEAEYSEQYAFWAGPLRTVTSLRRARPLLVDFSDMDAPFVEVKRVQGVTSPVQ